MQDPATSVAYSIIQVHHNLMVVLIFVVVFVVYFVLRLYRFRLSKETTQKVGYASRVVHGSVIEMIWTTIPAMILVVISVPSFSLLYAMDESMFSFVTIKVVGHQWYWSYELGGYQLFWSWEDLSLQNGQSGFDSYLVSESDLSKGQFRQLEVDNRLYLPYNRHIRLLVTSSDVLHCWTIPSFGVKVDACPGRLNQVSFLIDRPGVFYGQCSEICGVNHSFMPICVEVVDSCILIPWNSLIVLCFKQLL